MYDVIGYHRPDSLGEALELLSAHDRVALAGGVHLRHEPSGSRTDIVDLQRAGLDGIDLIGSTLTLGATVPLQSLVDDPRVPELIREAARAEQPSTLRTLATVGGTIAVAFGDSLLLASLLVHDTVVRLASHGRDEYTVPLADLLEAGCERGELIVDVTVATLGTGAIARTGRTPRDRPIVAVVGRRVEHPAGDLTRLAVCGVGRVPVLIDRDGVGSIEPIEDHRATSSYRRHLAEVLTARVREDLA
jgi:CO/xanthine dehydrogenase FAD-binding subunit